MSSIEFVKMVKDLAKIGGFDDGDDASEILHGGSSDAVDGTLLEQRHA